MSNNAESSIWIERSDDGRVHKKATAALEEIGARHAFTTRLFFLRDEPVKPGIGLSVGPADCVEKWCVQLSGFNEVCFCFPPSVATDRPWIHEPEPMRSNRGMIAAFAEAFRALLRVSTPNEAPVT